jgi:hypothetical protein
MAHSNAVRGRRRRRSAGLEVAQGGEGGRGSLPRGHATANDLQPSQKSTTGSHDAAGRCHHPPTEAGKRFIPCNCERFSPVPWEMDVCACGHPLSEHALQRSQKIPTRTLDPAREVPPLTPAQAAHHLEPLPPLDRVKLADGLAKTLRQSLEPHGLGFVLLIVELGKHDGEASARTNLNTDGFGRTLAAALAAAPGQ